MMNLAMETTRKPNVAGAGTCAAADRLAKSVILNCDGLYARPSGAKAPTSPTLRSTKGARNANSALSNGPTRQAELPTGRSTSTPKIHFGGKLVHGTD